MSDLVTFRAYLAGRRKLLGEIEQRLCDRQKKYESHFAEIDRAREAELQQLAKLIVEQRERLPGDFLERLDRQLEHQSQLLDDKLAALRREQETLSRQADALRHKSLGAERRLRQRNLQLDDEEEKLKARREELLAAIAEFNRRIRELSRGFGFFKNLPALRRLQKQKQALEQQQQDLAARIESLRGRWRSAARKGAEAERRRRARWLELRSEATARQAKLEYLAANAARIVERSALEAVLFELAAEPTPVTAEQPPCPRCGVANPPGNMFCRACALRLGQDRPDFAGSLREVAELNHHHRRFAAGLQACQQLIGLVRGIVSGLRAMEKSVEDMLDSQSRHRLPQLRIEVPAACREYGRVFERLAELVQDGRAVLPAEFAARVEELLAGQLEERSLKNYFETMGRELGRQADRQW